MQIKSQADFYSGLMFIGLGIAFAWGATNYSIGSAARMGPGYFPLMLGTGMALLGMVITIKALITTTIDGDPVGKWAWRPLFYIIGANFIFGLLLAGMRSISFPAFGLMIAIYALTFLSAMAQADWTFIRTFALATVLAAGSYLVFVMALALQFPVWPDFITG